MKFFIKDFFSQCDQIRRKLGIWSHLLKKSLMENFIFCAVIFSIRRRSELFYKKIILKNFEKYKDKLQNKALFFNKVHQKRDFRTEIFV